MSFRWPRSKRLAFVHLDILRRCAILAAFGVEADINGRPGPGGSVAIGVVPVRRGIGRYLGTADMAGLGAGCGGSRMMWWTTPAPGIECAKG